MGVMDVVFGEDIVLDESAFDTAIQDFNALRTQLEKLKTDIEDMLNDLKTGFDTPAGRQFIASCEKNLSQPLKAQELVLNHISTTLTESKQAYESVFQEYEALQTAINQVNN